MRFRDLVALEVLPLVYHFDRESARKGHRLVEATDDELATWTYRLAEAMDRERLARNAADRARRQHERA